MDKAEVQRLHDAVCRALGREPGERGVQVDVAFILNTHPQTYNRALKGRQGLRLETARQWVAAYNRWAAEVEPPVPPITMIIGDKVDFEVRE